MLSPRNTRMATAASVLLLCILTSRAQTINMMLPATWETEQELQKIAATDLDGDGFPDLITSSAGGLEVRWGTGDGKVSERYVIDVGVQGPAMAFADYNGDQNTDIAIAAPEDSLFIYTNQGQRSFQSAARYKVNIHYPRALSTADFDGNGRPDLVLVGEDEAAVVLMNREGVFDPSQIDVGNFSFIMYKE